MPEAGGNSVHLITYVDRLAGDLAALREVLAGPLAGLFDGVHILPFFSPYDGADAGFDPVDHTRVDERLGSWQDVEALAAGVTVTADLIVNHVSASSEQFRDYLLRGAESPHAGMFVTLADVFPHGAREADLAGIYRPRPGLPFTAYRVAGQRRLLWTTFTGQQIDLNLTSPSGRRYLDTVLRTLTTHGVRLLRLDAVGYAIKTPGTSCFMTAETSRFIDELTAQAHGLGAEVLVEVHSHIDHQVALAHQVDWVYDFALPPLLLHAVATGDVSPLARWLQMRPRNCVTVLDTHDGIGVVDVGPSAETGRPGLLDSDQLASLVEHVHRNTQGESRQATGVSASNLDLYQVNSTYYDALGRDDRAYLVARAVQLFLPGIPQVYYVGLLAGHNDVDLLASSGVGRDINRHRYSRSELHAQLRRPVVVALLELIRLRRHRPELAGRFSWVADATSLTLSWRGESGRLECRAEFADPRCVIEATTAEGTSVLFDTRRVAGRTGVPG